MGTLRRFDLTHFACDVFFETGTGTGGSLAYAHEAGNFSRFYSVEIHAETARFAQIRFANAGNTKIINSSSASALDSYLDEIDLGSPILFFLDAHFPGEASKDFGGYKYSEPRELKLPLANEVKIIKHRRPLCDDVIIVDDLRIYEDGPFEYGGMPEWAQTLDEVDRSISFICDTFPDRKILRDYRDEGYLLIVPYGKTYPFEKTSLVSSFKTYLKSNRLVRKLTMSVVLMMIWHWQF
jgi:hypothetical protein